MKIGDPVEDHVVGATDGQNLEIHRAQERLAQGVEQEPESLACALERRTAED
jgi:hypothetical protein